MSLSQLGMVAPVQADPPQLIVGTLGAISRMIAINTLRTSAISAVVIDEVTAYSNFSYLISRSSRESLQLVLMVQVDALTGAAKEGGLLGKLLTVHTDVQKRQTIFVSATVPQHNHFVRECIRNKWAKVSNRPPASSVLYSSLAFFHIPESCSESASVEVEKEGSMSIWVVGCSCD